MTPSANNPVIHAMSEQNASEQLPPTSVSKEAAPGSPAAPAAPAPPPQGDTRTYSKTGSQACSYANGNGSQGSPRACGKARSGSSQKRCAGFSCYACSSGSSPQADDHSRSEAGSQGACRRTDSPRDQGSIVSSRAVVRITAATAGGCPYQARPSCPLCHKHTKLLSAARPGASPAAVLCAAAHTGGLPLPGSFRFGHLSGRSQIRHTQPEPAAVPGHAVHFFPYQLLVPERFLHRPELHPVHGHDRQSGCQAAYTGSLRGSQP